MARLKIVKFGDPMLRKVSRPVTEITPRIITLLDDMIDTMRAEGGCGLAAVQVGVLRRIAVIEVDEGKVIELINPKIIAFAGEQTEQEGCLSNPGEYGYTKRPKAVTVRAMDRHGKEFEVSGSDLLARAICHECDHLDGKLYIDVQIRPARED
ncbi:MAG: peptide deformylase [Clostridia bacterium]|nr:peptide deformylase [Clostridia bacterium]